MCIPSRLRHLHLEAGYKSRLEYEIGKFLTSIMSQNDEYRSNADLFDVSNHELFNSEVLSVL